MEDAMSARGVLSIAVSLLAFNCKGPEGPAGPAGPPGGGVELLTDPRVLPKVIYTYPPMNSQGPYDNFTNSVVVRFNKIMDIPSLRRSIQVSSPEGNVRTDSAHIYTSGGDIFTV